MTISDSCRSSGLLLQSGDPDPVGTQCLDEPSPFVLVCDHAGNAVPRQLDQLGLPECELNRHIGIDIGALEVARLLSALLDAPLIYQRYSRLVIDCNRDPRDASSRPGMSDGTYIPANQNLGEGAAGRRITEIFTPYHEAIRELLDRRTAQGRTNVLVAVHSFTPQLRSVDSDRPWHTDIMFDRDPRVGEALLELFADEAGILAGENEPYGVNKLNDYTIPVHGEHKGIAHVGIEIRQDLLSSADGQHAWASRLARLLPKAIHNAGIG